MFLGSSLNLSAHLQLCLRVTAPFEEMLHRWPAVGNSVFNLTGLRFEPQTSFFRDEDVTARPADKI